ncbi:MAG: glycogen debranching protein GlgX, partial [Polaromonas sp.]
RQDPTLNRVKLIAEPWDLGHGGYQVGHFPLGWAEWNDRYRDGMRAYWKGDGDTIGEVARRLTGSSDLYAHSGKRPCASINFVTAHDGFTLHDLVSYNDKHNEANGEDNRDGNNNNLSWNCGIEGPTDDPAINQIRERQKRNFLATLLLSQGVPMLLAGDEIGNTQDGNNNAYCQNNAIGWLDWSPGKERTALLGFVRRLIALRRAHPTFRRREFFVGRPVNGDPLKDIVWIKPDGSEMRDEDWGDGNARCLGLFIAGSGIADIGRHGESIADDDFLLLFNAHHEDVGFVIPDLSGAPWSALLDTATETGEAPPQAYAVGASCKLLARSLALLTRALPESP